MACREMILDLAQGYNSTVFAYGQTGAGKSYTMFGPDTNETGVANLGESSGVIPRAADHLFELVGAATASGTECKVSVALVEIYQESVHDLLTRVDGGGMGQGLRVRESPTEGVYVENLTWVVVYDKKEIMHQLDTGLK